MAWTYRQSTGEIEHKGLMLGRGYAGEGHLKNVPGAESRANEGPLPQGTYTIASYFVDHPITGKHSLQLIPNSRNRMYGRSRFLIRGDDSARAGKSSEGCIVAADHIRLLMLHSADKTLQVIS